MNTTEAHNASTCVLECLFTFTNYNDRCKPIPIQSLTLMQFCIAIIRHLHQTNLFSCPYVTNTLMMALLFIRHHVVANDDNDCRKSNLLRYLLMLPITYKMFSVKIIQKGKNG